MLEDEDLAIAKGSNLLRYFQFATSTINQCHVIFNNRRSCDHSNKQMVAVTMLICLILPIHYDSISPYHCKILNSLSHPFVSHIHHVSNLNSISSRKCSFTICELVRIRYITLNACQPYMVFHRLQKTEA